MLYTDAKYIPINHVPLPGNRVATRARVVGTKHFAVIVEPSLGCEGRTDVQTFTGRWAWRHAREEFFMLVKG